MYQYLFTYVFGGPSKTLLAYMLGHGESAWILQVSISRDCAWKPYPPLGLGPNMVYHMQDQAHAYVTAGHIALHQPRQLFLQSQNTTWCGDILSDC